MNDNVGTEKTKTEGMAKAGKDTDLMKQRLTLVMDGCGARGHRQGRRMNECRRGRRGWECLFADNGIAYEG